MHKPFHVPFHQKSSEENAMGPFQKAAGLGTAVLLAEEPPTRWQYSEKVFSVLRRLVRHTVRGRVYAPLTVGRRTTTDDDDGRTGRTDRGRRRRDGRRTDAGQDRGRRRRNGRRTTTTDDGRRRRTDENIHFIQKTLKKWKRSFVVKPTFQPRISTILCTNINTYISNGFPIPWGPLVA